MLNKLMEPKNQVRRLTITFLKIKSQTIRKRPINVSLLQYVKIQMKKPYILNRTQIDLALNPKKALIDRQKLTTSLLILTSIQKKLPADLEHQKISKINRIMSVKRKRW